MMWMQSKGDHHTLMCLPIVTPILSPYSSKMVLISTQQVDGQYKTSSNGHIDIHIDNKKAALETVKTAKTTERIQEDHPTRL